MKVKIEKLTEELSFYFTKNYPKKIKNKLFQKYKVYLGIGGNIGDVLYRFESLFVSLKQSKKIVLFQTSPILKNPPFGYLEQRYFYNAILEVGTNLPPLYLLKTIQKIEKKFGRVRTFQDAPRTLDIDIIFIEKNGRNIKINHPILNIPHKGWGERKSVRIPLFYMQNLSKEIVKKNTKK